MKNIELLEVDPPLRAVRTFEAFARQGGVTAAARELAISPSAVSHQLRILEDFLQQPLTLRQGRNLILSEQGREYYRSIRSAFAVLRSATEHVREQSALRQVTISLIPLFGVGLFIPRLPAFLDEHPGVEVNVTYANHRSYPSDAADLSIRFGTGHWPGYRSERLLSGAMAAYCSRDYLARHGPLSTAEDLSGLQLLHDEERGGWGQWLQAAGVRQAARHDGLLFEDGLLTLHAALAGLGVALLREPLVRAHVASGQLVRLFEQALDDGRDYYLCCRTDGELSRECLGLYAWLKGHMGG
ncbi:DNA-binding transcriptional regulator, LysR family [Pseudomonas flavescens]|uniref:DNA-binding transcriptional regulator, LysR family n=1 Tax=Phytopseudomonas flavescens TaxID=29435 RepID=A0A1G8LIT3_9GAMM|nr:LysR substrate-binding domain-containing protein [Pseudomonas flavescens]SDI55604.1 DNA-binding transcriptional regulator, LysR family [Pseudomonas flavescens]